ncbi:uncharacterized protein LOC110452351 [Mizuhopecten yessoensis]|uniref:Bombyxin C-1 n=1 Tax=Mizuhopecten yessoensis TaxID=6573 RepID=A0A210QJU3_MIZYE|nr:uncharacterized protein LOC110452351 [Mizuhopecten yessoensis]OWF48999.1 Bombyxin C-1 [Mizuhopecten yessoensis]
MAQAALIILLSAAMGIHGSSHRMCGEQLADTLSLVCNGSFNKRSGLQHVKQDEKLTDVFKRSADSGVVEECCFREQGCTLATLQSYCAEPAFYDDVDETGTVDNTQEQATDMSPVQGEQNEVVQGETTTASAPLLNSRERAIAAHFLQIFRSGGRSRGNSNRRRPYWFFLPGLQLGQRATRRPYTVNTP